MEREQTAVEWLIGELDQLVSMLITNQLSISRYNELQNKLLDQAKQMEKEQIVEAHKDGVGELTDPRWKEIFQKKAEKYYESKYGKDESKA